MCRTSWKTLDGWPSDALRLVVKLLDDPALRLLDDRLPEPPPRTAIFTQACNLSPKHWDHPPIAVALACARQFFSRDKSLIPTILKAAGFSPQARAAFRRLYGFQPAYQLPCGILTLPQDTYYNRLKEAARNEPKMERIFLATFKDALHGDDFPSLAASRALSWEFVNTGAP